MKAKSGLFGAAIVAALLVVSTPVRAASTAIVDLTPQLLGAGLDIDGLQATDVGGIVILRGRTIDAQAAQRAGILAQQLGYNRIANLIQVVEPPDDAKIARLAERKLAMLRSLDGCSLRVDSRRGIVTLAGKVSSELQKDVAVNSVRNIDGVRGVRADFSD
jgi:osmotically-inducible protein OsmY